MTPAFPWPADRVARAVAFRAATPPDLDGRLAADCWRRAAWSPRFVDLVSGEAVPLATRGAVLWDDEHLYLGFRIEQPQVTATLTERDAHIWLDDDVEVFVAGDDAYYELEVNAFNTVYEVLFRWGEHPDGTPWDGVGFRHPRGPRTGFWDFDLPGLRTAVHVDGALNDPTTVDRGWSVEIALPWSGLAAVAGDRRLPPADGDAWRIALSRFNREHGEDSGGWAWSPHGVWDSHIPELFPLVTFVDRPGEAVTPR
ncbi:carbohydrate-binding family 9-like protein [Amnibacterium kyonggiense]|uniref:Carbohydrate binding protein with CBM9 domain n=1 Tax=Amnibacterium kyonggiense TaxID=595671 RepID=A0A4R7FLA0_9MICO|nr:carbohydrate-binding family 9-like protein [Amnibacterium kyonggiense]TDS77182.1 carbohydrate binding protein with CBM9 domain [Amnibacterium kyonggiense]